MQSCCNLCMFHTSFSAMFVFSVRDLLPGALLNEKPTPKIGARFLDSTYVADFWHIGACGRIGLSLGLLHCIAVVNISLCRILWTTLCLFDRKMFIGGLNWQTTPGMYSDANVFNIIVVVRVTLTGCCNGLRTRRYRHLFEGGESEGGTPSPFDYGVWAAS